MNKFTKGAIVIGAGIVMAIAIAIMCTVQIKAGYAGVVYNKNGGIEKETLGQGWHVINPLQHVTEYPVSTETVYLALDEKDNQSFDIGTADGKPISVDASYSYHMDVERLPEIFTKFRGRSAEIIANTYIKQSLKTSLNNVSTTYGMFDIYGNKRSEMTAKATELFKADMKQYGIIIENMNLMAVRPDNESMKAIQQKVNAIQALEQSKVEKEKALIEAEKQVEVAKKTAEAKVIAAQGEATANAKLAGSMTDQLVRYKQLEVQKAQAEAMKGWNVQYLINGNTGGMILPSPTQTPTK